MNKLLIIAFTIATSFSLNAQASSKSSDDLGSLAQLRFDRLTPCQGWQRFTPSSGGSGYMCTWRGMSSYIVDRYSLENAFADLERKNQDLAARLLEVERKIDNLSNAK